MAPFVIGLLLATNASFNIAVTTVEDPKIAWIEQLHVCENRNNVVRILDVNNEYSYGYLMFQMSTWLSFGKKFGTTKDNISDPELQKIVARDMLDRGLWRHWYTCAKKTTRVLGDYDPTT